MAVPLFMLISGFVYSKSYINKNTFEMKEVYEFSVMAKRIMRYTIPYVIVYFFEAILSFVFQTHAANYLSLRFF